MRERGWVGEGRSAKTQGTQVIPVIEGALGRQQEAQSQRMLNKNIFKAEWTMSKMPWSS